MSISRTKLVAAIIVIVVVIASLAYVFYIQPAMQRTAEEEERRRTLVVATDELFAREMDPGTAAGTATAGEIPTNLFDRLVEFKPPDFNDFEPSLAESWEILDEAKTFIFHLREGVKFHDGTPFNASAVKFSLERSLNESTYFKPLVGDAISSIEVVDNYTVKITTKDSMAPLLSILTHFTASIVSPTAVAKYGENFHEHLVGTGPFKLESVEPGIQLVAVRNEEYWRGAPFLKKIIWRVISEASTRRLELEKGTVDVVPHGVQQVYISYADVEAFRANPDIDVIEWPGLAVRYLGFNMKREPFTDIRVRQAIAYAIDYDQIISVILEGYAVRAYGPITPPTLWYNPAVEEAGFEQNVTKAKALLTEAGYSDGFETTILCLATKTWLDLATVIQSNLKDIGIDAEILQMEVAALVDYARAAKHNLYLLGRLPKYNDPDNFLIDQYNPEYEGYPNVFLFSDEDVYAKILEARRETNSTRRQELYFEIQLAILEQVPAAYLFCPTAIAFVRNNVHNYQKSVTLFASYYTITKD